MSVSTPAVRHPLVSGLVLTLLASLLSLALPVRPAGADAQDDAVAAAAAVWLVGEYDAGSVSSGGGLSDLIFALAGNGQAPGTVASARADLETLAADYIGGDELDEGPLGKALLGIIAGGGDGNDVGGLDLEAALRGLMQTEGGDAGRFDDANVFTQSLAMLGLAATDGGVPDAAAQWLADRRCPNGGWTFGLMEAVGDSAGVSLPCPTDGGGDVDTTGLAVQALLSTTDQADARDDAVAWLLEQQADDGSFGDNTNTTGLAGQALRAVGQVEAADAAADFVGTLQYGPDETEAGAIRYTASDDGSLLLATTQAVLTLGAPALQLIRAADPTPGEETGACVDDAGVTVVVDLTFFDGGVMTGCAAGDPASGLDALRGAGFEVTTAVSDFGEFVCAIEGLPELACDQPFEGQYWAYFSGRSDGAWDDYQVGADASDPAPGDVEGWAYSDGAAPAIAAPGAVARRIAGASRIATAIAASQDAFADGSAGAVVLARADAFADALAGTPLAAAVDGPLLTSDSDALPADVAAEIARVLPSGGTVYVLGGTAAISEEVVRVVEDLGFVATRLSGADRISTAVAVADQIAEMGDVTSILLTTGGTFADALAAGTAAAAIGDSVVLLTADGQPHPAVDDFLARTPEAATFAIGGPASAAYPGADPIVGDSREATAVAVAEAFFDAPAVVGIARRDDFADALAGGVHISRLGGPLLITPTGSLDPGVMAWLCSNGVTQAIIYGGDSAVDRVTSLAVADAVSGQSCS